MLLIFVHHLFLLFHGSGIISLFELQEKIEKPTEVILDGDLTIKKFAKKIGTSAGIWQIFIMLLYRYMFYI